jgi:hypothetical protein
MGNPASICILHLDAWHVKRFWCHYAHKAITINLFEILKKYSGIEICIRAILEREVKEGIGIKINPTIERDEGRRSIRIGYQNQGNPDL